MTIIESEQPGIEGKVELFEFFGNEVLINPPLLGAGNGAWSRRWCWRPLRDRFLARYYASRSMSSGFICSTPRVACRF